MNLLLSDPAFLLVASGVSYDPDAAAYIARVEGASGDNQALETAVKDAINAFVVGCKADGIWNAIKASCILAGARTLNGALQPLIGTAPTPYNFVAGDYNRKTGLVGNSVDKALDTNRSVTADPQDNTHISSFFSNSTGVGIGSTGSTVSPGVGLTILNFTSPVGGRLRNNNYTVSTINASTGFGGFTRSSSTGFTARAAGQSEFLAAASTAFIGTGNLYTHRFQGVGFDNYYNVRIAFYSIGESLDLALLDARVTTLINAFSTAIP